MNIKLIHENGHWYVVVSSVSGKFREDVTHLVEQEVAAEVTQITQKMIHDLAGAELKRVHDQVAEAVGILSNLTG
jgi:hypothetical protein